MEIGSRFFPLTLHSPDPQGDEGIQAMVFRLKELQLELQQLTKEEK